MTDHDSQYLFPLRQQLASLAQLIKQFLSIRKCALDLNDGARCRKWDKRELSAFEKTRKLRRIPNNEVALADSI